MYHIMSVPDLVFMQQGYTGFPNICRSIQKRRYVNALHNQLLAQEFYQILNLQIMNKILEDFRCTKEAIQHNFNKIFEYMKTTSTFSNKTKKLNKAFSRLIQEVNYEYLQSAILFAKRNIVHPSIITPNHHLKKVLSSQINIGGDSL